MSDLTFKTLHVNTTGLRGLADIVKAEVEQNFTPNVKRVVPILNGMSAFGAFSDQDDFPDMHMAGMWHGQAMGGQQGGLLYMAVMLTMGMKALQDGLSHAAKAYGGRDNLNALDVKAVEGLFLDKRALEKVAAERGQPPEPTPDPAAVFGMPTTERHPEKYAWTGEVEDPLNPSRYGDVPIGEDDEAYPDVTDDPLIELAKKHPPAVTKKVTPGPTPSPS